MAELHLGSFLGEKLVVGDYSDIYLEGIACNKNYIPKIHGNVNYMLWENVEELYIGGTIRTLNFVPSGEDRTITIVDSSNNHIDFSLSGWFRMKEESKTSFSTIYSLILNNISARQWTQFLQKLRNGQRYSFRTFEVAQDAFYFHKLFRGFDDKKDIAYIRGYDMNQGYFYIQFQEPNKRLKTKNVGQVVKIPNIHLVQSFIGMISKGNTH